MRLCSGLLDTAFDATFVVDGHVHGEIYSDVHRLYAYRHTYWSVGPRAVRRPCRGYPNRNGPPPPQVAMGPSAQVPDLGEQETIAYRLYIHTYIHVLPLIFPVIVSLLFLWLSLHEATYVFVL